MTEYLIRPAAESDLQAIFEIEAASFGSTAWPFEMMQTELAPNPSRNYFVATLDGAVVGYAGIGVVDGHEADVMTIAVSDSHRGAGLGRRLMNRLIDVAAKRQAREMFLEVRADSPVPQALYRSLGFEQIDLRKGYYQPEGIDAVIMRLDLSARIRELAQARLSEPVVLGIESSCDETGVGIVRGNTLLANAVSSSMDAHARFGGVVPEVAARAHLEAIKPTLDQALKTAGLSINEIDAIAVTNGPGLAGALMVGVGAAKALAVATGKPIYAVNHLVGHVGVDVLERGEVHTPTVALLVSGGHTSLLLVRDLIEDVELLGETIDDAAGEAFDKSAKLLGLPYPGGPGLSRLAEQGNPAAYKLPRPLLHSGDLDFSFAGLKTAVLTQSKKIGAAAQTEGAPERADLAASTQAAIVEVLCKKAMAALQNTGLRRLVVAGGVGANRELRRQLNALCEKARVRVHYPELHLCTDNGAMIAMAAAMRLQAGMQTAEPRYSFDVKPRWPLHELG